MSIILIRHGPTQFNSEGNQASSQERVRGWSDPPLSEEGERIADEVAQFMSQFPIEHIYTSDFQRASKTAYAISDTTGKDVTETDQLRSWNLGDFSGKPLKDVEGFIDKLSDNPDQPAPQGESLNDFLDRLVPFLQNLIGQDGLYAVVTHGRAVKVAKTLMDGNGSIDYDRLKDEQWVDPGEAMYVDSDGYELLNDQDGKDVTKPTGDTGKGHA